MPSKRKVASKKSSVSRVGKKTTPAHKNVFVSLLIAFLVVAGIFAYVKTQAVPTDVMLVGQANSFSYMDRFGNGQIDKGEWKVVKTDGVTVTETATDNLRMTVPTGAVSGKARSGAVSFKEPVSDGQNFIFRTRLYKPVVSGAGVGKSGIRFSGNDGSEDEGVLVYWEVNGATSNIVFQVNSQGKNVTTERVAVVGNQAELMVKRSDNEYSAAYRMNNFDDDNPFEELGQPVESISESGGRVRLFTTNTGLNGAYPRVVSRFDQVTLRSNTSTKAVSDSFGGDGAVDTSKWVTSKRGDSTTIAKANGNLVMNLLAVAKPAGATGDLTVNMARVTSTVDVAKDKRGMATVELFKPRVVGDGTGVAGLLFTSDSAKNEESALVRWTVGKDGNRLVFLVRNGAGNVEERAAVNVPNKRGRLTVKLLHGDGQYKAMYRLGPGSDDDQDFKVLGSERAPKLGAKGSFALFAHQIPAGNTAPAVNAKFDSFIVSYY
jgi:hypothetical protein